MCPGGTFARKGVCERCDIGCNKCGAEGVCLGCQNGSVLQFGMCISTCVLGSFNLNNTCQLCLNHTINQVKNTTLQCIAPYVRDLDDNCKLECSLGSYPYLGTCYSCPLECSSCNSQQICTSCSQGFLLQENTCVETCGIGLYRDGSGCLRCNSNCLACSNSPANCISCKNGLYLNEGKCVIDCPVSFTSTARDRCIACNHQCLSCQTLPYKCTSCRSPYSLLNFDCLEACPDGFYSRLGKCLPCDSSCSACSGIDSCTSCHTPYQLQSQRCIH